MAGRTGLYPGSFDPVTYGHVDLIRRSLSLVDRLVVAVLPNAGKAALLPLPEREALLRAVIDSELGDDARRVDVRRRSPASRRRKHNQRGSSHLCLTSYVLLLFSFSFFFSPLLPLVFGFISF